MTTLNPIDFDDLWLHPTPKGMKFSKPGQEEMAPICLRAIVEASARDDWWISEVHMVNKDFVGNRAMEWVNELEGDFLEEAKQFLYDQFDDRLTDKVHLEVLPEVA